MNQNLRRALIDYLPATDKYSTLSMVDRIGAIDEVFGADDTAEQRKARFTIARDRAHEGIMANIRPRNPVEYKRHSNDYRLFHGLADYRIIDNHVSDEQFAEFMEQKRLTEDEADRVLSFACGVSSSFGFWPTAFDVAAIYAENR